MSISGSGWSTSGAAISRFVLIRSSSTMSPGRPAGSRRHWRTVGSCSIAGAIACRATTWNSGGASATRSSGMIRASRYPRTVGLASRIPILRRCPVITAVETERPSLRWAIKNPAPNDSSAEFWGDTHFARQLAAALQGLGQEVIIDQRPAYDRPSGTFDDVVLVLRGVAPYRPQYGQINLGWLISHPEMLSREEASSYDRLFAASDTWAEQDIPGVGNPSRSLAPGHGPRAVQSRSGTSRHRPSSALRR